MGGNSSYKDISVNLVICEVIEGICMIAVNCFILISGYWGSDATFQWKKVFQTCVTNMGVFCFDLFCFVYYRCSQI